MNTKSITATLRIKLLLGATLLACVAATPFVAADSCAHESARTLAFAGSLLKIGNDRWAVEGHAELAVAEISTVAVVPSSKVAARAKPQGGSGGPQPQQATTGGATTCPVSHTSCPQELTLCPTRPTHCPAQSTVCVTTQCPPQATACPEQATVCQVTTCPAVTTSCPTTSTLCPQVRTQCPYDATRCPVVSTTCPVTYTVCNTLATHCPKDPTVCEHTVCPANATHCPVVATHCDFTTCNTDSESSCSQMAICHLCGLSYQEGPPVGYLAPLRVTGATNVRAETTAALAPRLTFLR